MNPLEVLIRAEISAKGAMPLERFMELCLYHPEHGYYSRAVNFAASGGVRDFVTAPELTPLFGYVLARWVVREWERLGAPEQWVLLEWGPGRGVLMRDMLLRLREMSPQAVAGCDVCLWEVADGLRGLQRGILEHERVRWVFGWEEVQGKGPIVAIGNEVMDAFPLRQWGERGEQAVCVGAAGALAFVLSDNEILGEEQVGLRDWLGAVKEYCAVALLVDYGAEREESGIRNQESGVAGGGEESGPAFRPTLQAMQRHAFVSPLADPGDVDLTAHVDFGVVAGALGRGCAVSGLAEFLMANGILDEGLARLEFAGALQKLLHPAEMGGLFKVVVFRGKEDRL